MFRRINHFGRLRPLPVSVSSGRVVQPWTRRRLPFRAKCGRKKARFFWRPATVGNFVRLCFSRGRVYNGVMSNNVKDDRSENDEGWAALIAGLRAGDQAIVRDFCAEYGDALFRLADKHLADGLRRRIGPEDVVQLACRTFSAERKGESFNSTTTAPCGASSARSRSRKSASSPAFISAANAACNAR